MDNLWKLLAGDDVGYIKSKSLVNDMELRLKPNEIDSLLDDIFAQKNRKLLRSVKNKSFLETIACCYCWNRLHRGGIYKRIGDAWRIDKNKTKKALNILSITRKICGQVSLVPFFEFFCYCCLSSYDLAFKCIEGKVYPDDAYKSGFFLGAKTAIPHDKFLYDLDFNQEFFNDFFSDEVLEKQLSEIKTSVDDFEYEVVFLISCTLNYYYKFAEYFVGALSKCRSNALVVFLVVDNQKEIEKGIGQEVSFSDVYTVFLQSEASDLASLSATLRFLAAPLVIRALGTSLIVCDIDSTFDCANYKLIKDKTIDFSSDEVGLSFNVYGRSRIPWASIPAALCYFPNSESSLFYLYLVRSYFDKAFQPEERNWWIDQNALYMAYVAYREFFKSDGIINLIEEKKMISDNYKSEVVFFKKNNRFNGHKRG